MRFTPFAILLVGCGFDTYYPVVPGDLAPGGGTVPCSGSLGAPALLQVVSTVDEPLRLSEVAVSNCAIVFYADLPPRGVIEIDTTDQIVWVVSTQDATVLAHFQVPAGSSTWTQEVP